MKLIVLLVVVVVVLWLARAVRRRVGGNDSAPPRVAEHEPMVACSHCGLHLPRGEALPGRGGVFCSEDHRAAFERAAK